MKYSLSDFKKDIEEVILACQEELIEISKGNQNQATIWQIKDTIIPEMEELLEMIEENKIPPKGQRWLKSAAYITRGWNWDIWGKEKLTMLLPKLDNKYRHELDELDRLRFNKQKQKAKLQKEWESFLKLKFPAIPEEDEVIDLFAEFDLLDGHIAGLVSSYLKNSKIRFELLDADSEFNKILEKVHIRPKSVIDILNRKKQLDKMVQMIKQIEGITK